MKKRIINQRARRELTVDRAPPDRHEAVIVISDVATDMWKGSLLAVLVLTGRIPD